VAACVECTLNAENMVPAIANPFAALEQLSSVRFSCAKLPKIPIEQLPIPFLL